MQYWIHHRPYMYDKWHPCIDEAFVYPSKLICFLTAAFFLSHYYSSAFSAKLSVLQYHEEHNVGVSFNINLRTLGKKCMLIKRIKFPLGVPLTRSRRRKKAR